MKEALHTNDAHYLKKGEKTIRACGEAPWLVFRSHKEGEHTPRRQKRTVGGKCVQEAMATRTCQQRTARVALGALSVGVAWAVGGGQVGTLAVRLRIAVRQRRAAAGAHQSSLVVPPTSNRVPVGVTDGVRRLITAVERIGGEEQLCGHFTPHGREGALVEGGGV